MLHLLQEELTGIIIDCRDGDSNQCTYVRLPCYKFDDTYH